MSIRRTAQLLTAGLLGTLACSRDQPGSRDQAAAPAAAPTDGTTPAPRAAAAAPPAPTATATPVAPVAPATITLAAPAASGGGPKVAQRCALDGAPLGQHPALVTVDDAIYVSDGAAVRRYRRDGGGDGDGCTLALDAGFGRAGQVAIPALEPKPQTLGKGPIYMQSGGADWKLGAAAGGVYAFDLLRGLYRVDRGRWEPACKDLQGLRALAGHGKSVTVWRDGVQALALRGCKLGETQTKAVRALGAVGADLWIARDGKTLERRAAGESTASATITSGDSFAPGGFCSLTAVTACGDGVCVVDNNCMKIARFDRAGQFTRELDTGALFATRPYGLSGASTSAGGDLFLAATHREPGAGAGEGAIYRIAAAEF